MSSHRNLTEILEKNHAVGGAQYLAKSAHVLPMSSWRGVDRQVRRASLRMGLDEVLDLRGKAIRNPVLLLLHRLGLA